MIYNVLEYLESSKNKFPNKTVFSENEQKYSYQELINISKKIGTSLSKNIDNDNKPIAVLMEKGIDSLATYFGIVYSGHPYSPIDNEMPIKRIKLILEVLDFPIVVTDDNGMNILKAIKYTGRIINFNQAISDEIDDDILNTIRNKHIDTDPLYIIFTSGSTGVPKGVVLNHKNIIDLVEWIVPALKFDENTVFGNQTPFFFDASVKDIYSTIKCGATLEIIPKKFFGMTGRLFEYLVDKKINTILWATSALCIAANEKIFEIKIPKTLKTIAFAGEALPVNALNIWKKYLPEAKYVNLYGPTETAVDCTYYILDNNFTYKDNIPIGNPCKNIDILLIKDNKKAKPGEIGEIYVRGTSVSMGYYNNKERSDEAFVQNPLNNKYSEIVYRTGDIGVYNEKGELLFLTRKDDQIKHRGYRIEIGEIENALNSLEGIDRACCIFDEDKDLIICIYVGNIDKKGIIIEIKKIIPKYMWPNRFVKLAELPISLNGKIDRNYLREKYCNE